MRTGPAAASLVSILPLASAPRSVIRELDKSANLRVCAASSGRVLSYYHWHQPICHEPGSENAPIDSKSDTSSTFLNFEAGGAHGPLHALQSCLLSCRWLK